ncbi:MAG: 4Fe-4S dicluster domain-containing protein [Promethearchaeota archaeon]
MVQKIIPKTEISSLLTRLNKEFQVYVPIKGESGIRFSLFNEESVVMLDKFQNVHYPPKEIHFPQTEELFSTISIDNKSKIVEPAPITKDQIIFGVRNCDARSFQVLDTFFSSGQYDDPYYFRRRNHSIVIGLACNNPQSSCFCTSVGGGPFSKESLDAFLVDLGDKYFFESLSSKFDKLNSYFQDYSSPSDKDHDRIKELEQISLSKISWELSLDTLETKLDDKFNDEIWDRNAETCLNCSVCTFYCPTCHCFDVQDKKTDQGIKRIRIWDSCQSGLFTLEASGHNPRLMGNSKFRQRIFHKFNYYPKNYQILGCVGCGRCIRHCPESNDIRKILKEIIEVK